MRNQLVMGMAMAVAVSFSMNAYAAGAAKAVDVRVQYKDRIETKYELKGKTSETMSQAEVKAAHDRILKDINLGSTSKASLSGSLSKRPVESLEILKTIAAVDMMVEAAKGAKDVNQKSVDAIQSAREALLVVLVNAKKIDAFSGPSIPGTMTEVQFKDATSALNKLLVESPKIASKYNLEEGAGAIKVIKELEQVMKENSSLTMQEAFVEAIVRAKGISRAEALKLLEKYKECV